MYYNPIRPGYYLRKWRYYEARKYELSAIELEQAKIFFNALKQINKAEFQILSDIYYSSREPCSFDSKTGYYHSLKPVRDKHVAEKYNVTLSKFKEMKYKAHNQLRLAMKKLMEIRGKFFIFKLNKKLYLVDILYKGTDGEQYVLGDESQATVYEWSQSNSSILKGLDLKGFERILVNE